MIVVSDSSPLFDPIRSWRQVVVRDQRTAIDFAEVVRDTVQAHYAEYDRVVLVLDNLNTHTVASLYKAFSAAEAFKLAQRTEWHYTPKHGSWLSMAEIELSVLSRLCLSRRIGEKEELKSAMASWSEQRNRKRGGVRWRFGLSEARCRLRHLYPSNDG